MVAYLGWRLLDTGVAILWFSDRDLCNFSISLGYPFRDYREDLWFDSLELFLLLGQLFFAGVTFLRDCSEELRVGTFRVLCFVSARSSSDSVSHVYELSWTFW